MNRRPTRAYWPRPSQGSRAFPTCAHMCARAVVSTRARASRRSARWPTPGHHGHEHVVVARGEPVIDGPNPSQGCARSRGRWTQGWAACAWWAGFRKEGGGHAGWLRQRQSYRPSVVMRRTSANMANRVCGALKIVFFLFWAVTAWRENDPRTRIATQKKKLRDISFCRPVHAVRGREHQV